MNEIELSFVDGNVMFYQASLLKMFTGVYVSL